MYYIYCYTNKLNNHKYVGQTNNPKRRYSEHKSSAFNINDKDYNELFHKKIRQYGLENFNFEILEELNTKDELYVDERERYWIKEKNSYVKNNHGYNIDEGGQHGSSRWTRSKITQEEVEQIYSLLLNTKLTQEAIAERFNVSQIYISKINQGIKFFNPDFHYPIRPDARSIEQNTLNQIRETIINCPKLTRQQIADLYGVSLSTVKRIREKLIKDGIISKKR